MFAVDDFGPESHFLRRIEEEAPGEISFFPCRAGEGLPVNDVGRGPRRQSLSAAAAMVFGLEGAGRTIA